MKCRNKDIKGLLPAYLEQGLGDAEKLRIEKHLETCEDCRTELSLLRAMAAEPVPDPGEAFWAQMPSGIYRQVQERRPGTKRPDVSALWRGLFMPRWAWATAAVAFAAVFSWFFVRPAQMDTTAAFPTGDEFSYEDALSAEPVDVAALSSSELDAAAKWAGSKLASIREEIGDDSMENAERDVYRDITDLSAEELERLDNMLEEQKQKTQKRLQKDKRKNPEKELG